jgi:hypothetical protein
MNWMNNCCICWFFTHISTKFSVQEAKSLVKNFVRQRCAEGFNSGVKGLNPKDYPEYFGNNYIMKYTNSFFRHQITLDSQWINRVLYRPKISYNSYLHNNLPLVCVWAQRKLYTQSHTILNTCFHSILHLHLDLSKSSSIASTSGVPRNSVLGGGVFSKFSSGQRAGRTRDLGMVAP